MTQYTYELDEFNNVIKRNDGLFIPINEANADYQRYLNPEAEQFTPMVTDEAATL